MKLQACRIDFSALLSALKAPNGSRFAHGIQNSVRVCLHNSNMHETGRSHPKSLKFKCTYNWIRSSHTWEIQSPGGQAYDRSSM
jgi:hypothetical protein